MISKIIIIFYFLGEGRLIITTYKTDDPETHGVSIGHIV